MKKTLVSSLLIKSGVKNTTKAQYKYWKLASMHEQPKTTDGWFKEIWLQNQGIEGSRGRNSEILKEGNINHTRQWPNAPFPRAISYDLLRPSSINFCLSDKLSIPLLMIVFKFRESNCHNTQNCQVFQLFIQNEMTYHSILVATYKYENKELSTLMRQGKFSRITTMNSWTNLQDKTKELNIFMHLGTTQCACSNQRTKTQIYKVLHCWCIPIRF